MWGIPCLCSVHLHNKIICFCSPSSLCKSLSGQGSGSVDHPWTAPAATCFPFLLSPWNSWGPWSHMFPSTPDCEAPPTFFSQDLFQQEASLRSSLDQSVKTAKTALTPSPGSAGLCEGSTRNLKPAFGLQAVLQWEAMEMSALVLGFDQRMQRGSLGHLGRPDNWPMV